MAAPGFEPGRYVAFLKRLSKNDVRATVLIHISI